MLKSGAATPFVGINCIQRLNLAKKVSMRQLGYDKNNMAVRINMEQCGACPDSEYAHPSCHQQVWQKGTAFSRG